MSTHVGEPTHVDTAENCLVECGQVRGGLGETAGRVHCLRPNTDGCGLGICHGIFQLSERSRGQCAAGIRHLPGMLKDWSERPSAHLQSRQVSGIWTNMMQIACR